MYCANESTKQNYDLCVVYVHDFLQVGRLISFLEPERLADFRPLRYLISLVVDR